MKIAPEDVQEFRFTVVKGAKPGGAVSFEGGLRTIKIGRAVENDIVVADPTVSRSHARVDIRADGWFLIDAGSAAGVEKMGFRVGSAPEPLDSGDEFKIGDTILRFEVVARKGALKKAAEPPKAPVDPGAPPPPSLLARIGLGTRRTQILAALALVLLGALALWPTAPELPPQSSAPLAADYNGQFGFMPGGDRSHLDAAVFHLPADGEGLGVYFEVLAPGGVEVRAGGRAVGRIEPADGWVTHQLVLITKAVAQDGKIRLIFDNLGWEPGASNDPAAQKAWGVRRLWIARVPDASSSLGQLADELQAVQRLADRLEDNLGIRNTIIKAIRRASLGLMKFAGRPAALLHIPEPKDIPAASLSDLVAAARTELGAERPDKALDRLTPVLQKADAELQREYRKVLNAIALAKKKGNPPELATLVATGMRLLPDNPDPRHRVMVAEAKQLKGRTAVLYNEALERLGSGFSG